MSEQNRSVLSSLWISLRLLALFLLICGVILPAVLFGFSHMVSPGPTRIQSVDSRTGEMSLTAGQPFSAMNHFWGRADRNLTIQMKDGEPVLYSLPENNDLSDPEYIQNREKLRQKIASVSLQPDREVPEELITASGSGMDPDITVECARYQIPRIARANGLKEQEVESLIDDCSRHGLVNTVLINLKLDELSA